jgi:alkylation response protein AidB-like acyl-CoA dehydrogenase
VDFRITDDQQLLQETTRKFLESTSPLETVRQLAESEPAGFTAEWWRRGAELGWTSLLVSEDDGGGSVSGHGLLDLVLVAEEMGRLVAPGPLVPTNVVAEALSRLGTETQKQELLPGLIEGAVTAAWCLGTTTAGFDPGGAVRAIPEGDGYVLDGTTGPVEAAGQAELLLITASTADGLVQVVVPAATAGVTMEGAHSIDMVRRFAQVRLDHVQVGADSVLQGSTDAEVEHQLETAAVLQCAEMAGAIDRVFEFTVEWSFDRYSFGRPLASYQALKHRFADMKLWLESSHATATAAARAVDAGSANAPELVSVAKAYIGEKGPAILQDCVQLHGGIGVTWDHDLHLYLRRVVVDQSQMGTPRDHRERVAVAMGMEAGR